MTCFGLMQVTPTEVVSMCDVDKKMLADAATLIATRAKTDKKPARTRLQGDAEGEETSDVVIIGTPDHWHACAMIALPWKAEPMCMCRSR